MAKASQVERRARVVCVELVRVTDRPMHLRAADAIDKALGLDHAASNAAIAVAEPRPVGSDQDGLLMNDDNASGKNG